MDTFPKHLPESLAPPPYHNDVQGVGGGGTSSVSSQSGSKEQHDPRMSMTSLASQIHRPGPIRKTRSKQLSNVIETITTKERRRPGVGSPLQLWMRRMLDQSQMDLALCLLFTTSFLLVIIETNYSADDSTDVPQWVIYANTVLSTMYFAEVVLRIYAYSKSFFWDWLNCFDLFVVTADALSTLINLGLGHNIGVPIELFRMARILKVARTVRIMMLFPELNLMLRSFVFALKSILWAVLMILSVLAFWGILGVMFIHPLNTKMAEAGYWDRTGCDRCPRAFASVQASMLTITQQVIAGDSWGTVTMPIIEQYPVTGLYFFAVLACVSLAVMNLILAVIVEKASEAREKSAKEEAQKKAREFEAASEQLLKLCEALDADGSGELSYGELLDGYDNNADFQDVMRAMDITRNDLEVVFNMLDFDRSGAVEYGEFVDQLHMMRSREAHTLLVFVKFYVMDIRYQVYNMMSTVFNTPTKMHSLTGKAKSRSKDFQEGSGPPSQWMSVASDPSREFDAMPHPKTVAHDVSAGPLMSTTVLPSSFSPAGASGDSSQPLLLVGGQGGYGSSKGDVLDQQQHQSSQPRCFSDELLLLLRQHSAKCDEQLRTLEALLSKERTKRGDSGQCTRLVGDKGGDLRSFELSTFSAPPKSAPSQGLDGDTNSPAVGTICCDAPAPAPNTTGDWRRTGSTESHHSGDSGGTIGV